MKVVVPAAGLGIRLLPATKEQPKEMLPVFRSGEDQSIYLAPIVQLVFDELFKLGARTFCFVVGRGKRALEDHFTPDPYFVEYLSRRGKKSQAAYLDAYYRRILESTIVWRNQPIPQGFGDAVSQARFLIDDEPFLVHAGDTHIISGSPSVVERLIGQQKKDAADATLVLKHVENTRHYGVAVIERGQALVVKEVEEKPSKPKSDLAIMPLYVFTASIFEALREIAPDRAGEIQLTDAIQRLIDTGHKVSAIILRPDDIRLDVGTPETYWESLELSRRFALGQIHEKQNWDSL